jgi:hypothetical protein
VFAKTNVVGASHNATDEKNSDGRYSQPSLLLFEHRTAQQIDAETTVLDRSRIKWSGATAKFLSRRERASWRDSAPLRCRQRWDHRDDNGLLAQASGEFIAFALMALPAALQ